MGLFAENEKLIFASVIGFVIKKPPGVITENDRGHSGGNITRRFSYGQPRLHLNLMLAKHSVKPKTIDQHYVYAVYSTVKP